MIYMSLIYVFLLVGPAVAAIAFFRRLFTGAVATKSLQVYVQP